MYLCIKVILLREIDDICSSSCRIDVFGDSKLSNTCGINCEGFSSSVKHASVSNICSSKCSCSNGEFHFYISFSWKPYWFGFCCTCIVCVCRSYCFSSEHDTCTSSGSYGVVSRSVWSKCCTFLKCCRSEDWHLVISNCTFYGDKVFSVIDWVWDWCWHIYIYIIKSSPILFWGGCFLMLFLNKELVYMKKRYFSHVFCFE